MELTLGDPCNAQARRPSLCSNSLLLLGLQRTTLQKGMASLLLKDR